MPQNYNACFPATTPPTLYTGTGTTTAFATGFPSLKQNDIVVFTGDNTTGVWNLAPQTDYTVNSQNAQNVQQVVFTAAPGQDVLIMRRTDLCVLVRNFQPGQSIRAQDLNNAFLQQLYLHQEMYSFIEQQFGDIILDGVSLQDTFWNKTTDTINSGDAWSPDDNHVVTALAGDNRWLNASGADIIGGPGITRSSTGSQITIEADLTANGGLEFSGAGNDREIRIDQGTGIDIDATGVHAGITTATVAQTGGNDDNPAIRVTDTLNGTATNNDLTIIGGNDITVTRNSDSQLTIDSTATDTNTTYDLTNANVGGNARLRLAGSDNTNDDVTISAGLNVSFSQISATGFTINSTGGGGGAGGATVVADIPDLNTAGAVPPAAGSLFLVLDSTGATAAAGAAPGNILAINDLPETPATGGPQGGYSPAINLTLEFDAANGRWQFIRWQVQNSDGRYVLEAGDTMTGPLIMDDTNIQITEGTDTLTLEWPVGTANRTIGFPDNSGTVALTTDVTAANTLQQVTTAGNVTQNNIVLQTGPGETNISLNANGSAVFNERGEDQDFRVEGDTNANLLFVDAGQDRVGFGTSSPTDFVEINGNTRVVGNVLIRSGNQLRLNSSDNSIVTNINADDATANATYTLPPAAGTAGQVLAIDTVASGDCELEWAAAGLPTTGGTMTGNIQFDGASVIADNGETVPNNNGNWDIQNSNVWQVANGATIVFPDNSAAPIPGQTGIFNCAGTVAGWTNANGGTWEHPGGTQQAGDAAGAVIPFYVESTTNIILGTQTVGS